MVISMQQMLMGVYNKCFKLQCKWRGDHYLLRAGKQFYPSIQLLEAALPYGSNTLRILENQGSSVGSSM